MKHLINEENLSLIERKVIEYIITNIDNLENISIKQISGFLKVSESLITKSCKKIKFNGFKEFKKHLLKQYHYKKQKNLQSDFYKALEDDLKITFNILNYDLIEEITSKFYQNQNKIIIFATGKTNIIAKYFYFTLLEYGLNVSILSSLYEIEGFDSKDAIIFVLSTSGNNSKVDRYLNILNSIKNYKFIIAITSTKNFTSTQDVDFHVYGEISNYFSTNQKANPFTEKYIMMYLVDNILLSFFEKFQKNDSEFFKRVESKNFI